MPINIFQTNRGKAGTFTWNAIRKILVHKPDHVGDVLAAAPAIDSLRKTAPEAKIIAAVTPSSGAFLEALNLVDDIHPMKGPSWWKSPRAAAFVLWARRQEFDLVLNLRHDLRDIALMRFLGAPFVCTYTHRGVGRFASHAGGAPRADLPESQNHLRLVSLLGVHAGTGIFQPTVPSKEQRANETILEAGKAWIAFHPFARTPAKRWETQKAKALLKALLGEGFGVVLVGGREHEKEAGELAGGLPGAVNLVGQTNAGRFLSILSRCVLVISTDSAPGHAGALVGTKVVSLMSGTNEAARWAPDGANVIKKDVPCAPCHLEKCPVSGHPCMSGIEPEAILQIVKEALAP